MICPHCLAIGVVTVLASIPILKLLVPLIKKHFK